MSDDDWNMVLEGTHEAVRTFARIEVEALTRKVIHRLQRIHSSGIFGDDYIYKTLWDEYCHEVLEGPHDMLENAWDLTIFAAPTTRRSDFGSPRTTAVAAVRDREQEMRRAVQRQSSEPKRDQSKR